MKSIQAQSTSGTEGVLIALFTWWLQESGLIHRVEAVAEECGVDAFYNFQDYEVGGVLLAKADGWESFRRSVIADPTASAIGATVDALAQKEPFCRMVSNELGARLKASAWWKDNVKAIEARKKALKVVRKVMES